MKRKTPVNGFDYRVHRPMTFTFGEWRDRIDEIVRAGGREKRDDDGALAVYLPSGKRALEIYDRDPTSQEVAS